MIQISQGGIDYYFIGVVDPDLLKNNVARKFTSPEKAIKTNIEKILKESKERSKRRIILLSHSGLQKDKEYAKLFKELDWIIGAHSQSYLRLTEEVGKTQIGQVLSRNHFLGKITFNREKSKKDAYEIIEVRDEKKDLIENNPMNSWLTTYKAKLDQLQEEEQSKISVSATNNHFPTNVSCIECHSRQGDFWQGTAHAISFKTLIDAKAANNTTCVGCHSLGYKEAKGYLIPKKIVLSDKKDFDIDEYWKEFNTNHELPGKSVRKLATKERKAYAKKWAVHDKKFEVTHNFANVQCLNCHNQTSEHPFDAGSTLKPDYEKACLSCHTGDQSPEWYLKDEKGMASKPNQEYIKKKIKEVSCPEIEKE